MTPMELLKHFAPEFADNQMPEKALIFENEKYQKVPNKYKMLVGIGVAAALGSDTCTQMWTKMAKQNKVTNEEIIERVWGFYCEGNSALVKNVIYRLRKKIEPNQERAQFIRTETGGYLFRQGVG